MSSMHYAGIGSRETPDSILDLIGKVSWSLDRLGYTLRSGAARGADTAFDMSCTKKVLFYEDYAVESSNGASRRIEYAPADIEFMEGFVQKHHPVPMALKGSPRKWMRRNTLQVMTHNLSDLELPQVDFVLCWTPDGSLDGSNRSAGGTGQALRIARHYGIPVFNLEPNPRHCLGRLKDHLVSIGVTK